MNSLNAEWENFTINANNNIKNDEEEEEDYIVKCSDIYISTKTKIAFLNLKHIDLVKTFWLIPILDYWMPKEGVLKKSMKFNCLTKSESEELDKKVLKEKNINMNTISKVINENKYKDVRKIDLGISHKDLTNFRKKKKGAFYNCFAIIMRIKQDNIFKEVHIKIFNTGKLEIPGIQNDETLYIALNNLCKLLKTILKVDVTYDKKNIENVLINSNFSCGFYVDRQKLHQLLKFQYNIHSLYDPCSYPGIQCKFFYNNNNKLDNGVCCCDKKCYNLKKGEKKENKCLEISFMIFRTGSVLIVGHCDELILYKVYNFLKNIFTKEYKNISQNIKAVPKKKIKQNKIRKKKIKIPIS